MTLSKKAQLEKDAERDLDNIRKRIREMIIYGRIKRNLTQQEMSDAIGINRVTFARYEDGTRNPNLFHLIRIAKVFTEPLPNFFKLD